MTGDFPAQSIAAADKTLLTLHQCRMGVGRDSILKRHDRNDQQVTCDYFSSLQAVGPANIRYRRAVLLRNGAQVVAQADAMAHRLNALFPGQLGEACAKNVCDRTGD